MNRPQFFSVKGIASLPDLSSALDKGGSTSASGIYTAVVFCRVYEIFFKTETPRWIYKRVCGHNGVAPQPAIATRTHTIHDINKESFRLMLDFTDDESPLKNGTDVQ